MAFPASGTVVPPLPGRVLSPVPGRVRGGWARTVEQAINARDSDSDKVFISAAAYEIMNRGKEEPMILHRAKQLHNYRGIVRRLTELLWRLAPAFRLSHLAISRMTGFG